MTGFRGRYAECMKNGISDLVQVSGRGQVTLPAEIRRDLGLEPGDALTVEVEDGRIVLEPMALVPAERYTDDRIEEFAEASRMTDEEVREARRRWDA